MKPYANNKRIALRVRDFLGKIDIENLKIMEIIAVFFNKEKLLFISISTDDDKLKKIKEDIKKAIDKEPKKSIAFNTLEIINKASDINKIDSKNNDSNALSNYTGVIALPEFCYLRPEISFTSPNFFNIVDYLPDSVIFIIRKSLKRKFIDLCNDYLNIKSEEQIYLNYDFFFISNSCINFFFRESDERINGLLAFVPNPIDKKHLSNDPSLIKDSLRGSEIYYMFSKPKMKNNRAYKCIDDVKKLSELKEKLKGKRCFVPGVLLPFLISDKEMECSNFDQHENFMDLDYVLSQACQYDFWKKKNIDNIKNWLKVPNESFDEPYKVIQNKLLVSRDSTKKRPERLELIEAAYFMVGEATKDVFCHIGYEKLLNHIHRELVKFLEDIIKENIEDKIYYNFLLQFYKGIETIWKDNLPQKVIINYSQESTEKLRFSKFSHLSDYISALLRLAVSENLRDKNRKEFFCDRFFYSLHKNIWYKTLNPNGFIIGNLANIFFCMDTLVRLFENNDDRPNRTEIVKRFKSFCHWQNIMPHERQIIERVIKALNKELENRIRKRFNPSDIECELLQKEFIIKNKDEHILVPVRIKNKGIHLPTSFTIKILSSQNYIFLGDSYVYTEKELRPEDDYDYEYKISLHSKSCQLIFELSWIHDGEDYDKKINTTITRKIPGETIFKDYKNLSPIGEHIEVPSKFQGRQAQVLDVIERILGENNVIITAHRRTGKSSLAKMVHSCINNKEIRSYFKIDDEMSQSIDAFFSVFFSIQGIEINKLEKTFYTEIINGLEKKINGTVNDWKEKDQISSDRFRYGLEQALTMLEAPYRNILIIIDEFDYFEKSSDFLNICDRLRKIIDTHKNIQWIIISATDLKSSLNTYSSPLFNIFYHNYLNNLPYDDFEKFVEGQLPETTFFSEAMFRLYQESSGHPFFTNKLLHHLYYNVIKVEELTTVDINSIERAVNHFIHDKDTDSTFSFALHDIDDISYQLLKNTCKLFERGVDAWNIVDLKKNIVQEYKKEIDLDTIKKSLEAFDKIGIMKRTGRGQWMFSVPIIIKWLQYKFLLQKDLK